MSMYFFNFQIVLSFFLGGRQRGNEWGEGREREERENPKHTPHCQLKPDTVLDPANSELMT